MTKYMLLNIIIRSEPVAIQSLKTRCKGSTFEDNIYELIRPSLSGWTKRVGKVKTLKDIFEAFLKTNSDLHFPRSMTYKNCLFNFLRYAAVLKLKPLSNFARILFACGSNNKFEVLYESLIRIDSRRFRSFG